MQDDTSAVLLLRERVLEQARKIVPNATAPMTALKRTDKHKSLGECSTLAKQLYCLVAGGVHTLGHKPDTDIACLTHMALWLFEGEVKKLRGVAWRTIAVSTDWYIIDIGPKRGMLAGNVTAHFGYGIRGQPTLPKDLTLPRATHPGDPFVRH